MSAILKLAKAGLFVAALLFTFAFTALAQTPTANRCESCGKVFATDGHYAHDLVRDRDRLVCQACSLLTINCAACNMPVGEKNPKRLPDGRTYCATDARNLVLDQREADHLFHEVKRDVARLLGEWLPVPDANITFILADKDEFLRYFAELKNPIHDPHLVLGITRTFRINGGPIQHAIIVLNGLVPAQFTATAAHELGHAWMHERTPALRTLNSDTLEGFCELVAWKVLDGRHEESEKKRLLASTYTHSQIQSLIAAEQRYRFFRVIEWVQNGADTWLDPDPRRAERLLVMREAAPAPVAQPLSAPAVASAPDTLLLRGILGTAKGGRVALVNDGTFAPGDKLKVRLGEGKVAVECLEIREQSVLLAVGESGERQELFLKKK
ncbi:MAG: protein DA1 [Verrucomicrobia bacterium]|nr:protein DA1 [Verrucomicrobiota bacterium]